MSPNKVYVYHAEAQLTDGSAVLLDLEERGWANKELLAATRRFSLIPKEGARTVNGGSFPIVVVNIPERAKVVFKTKVYGSLGASGEQGPTFRIYCVGYKLAGKTHLSFVMPTGDIEVTTDDSSFLAETLLSHLNGRD